MKSALRQTAGRLLPRKWAGDYSRRAHRSWYLSEIPISRGTSANGETRPLTWFDPEWYLTAYPELRSEGLDPLDHYLKFGSADGRQPNSWFDPGWYSAKYPDVLASNNEPLHHFGLWGWVEGRQANDWFDARWYDATHPPMEGSPAGDPLERYLASVAHPNSASACGFEPTWYLETYPDVAGAPVDPLRDYLAGGYREGKQPNPWFDPQWYLETNWDVKAAKIEPLEHFVTAGESEGRSPSEKFDAKWYLAQYPDVRDSGLKPFRHYALWGRTEGRVASPPHERDRPLPDLALLDPTPEFGRLLDWKLIPASSTTSRVTFLLPGFGKGWLTGGPMNAVAIAYQLSKHIRVRILSVNPSSEPASISEIESTLCESLGLSGIPDLERNFEVAVPGDLTCEEGEIFLATAWWTAVEAKRASFLANSRIPFFYLVQDYEPLLHASSSASAAAEETYSWASKKIVSSQSLLRFMQQNSLGSFGTAEDHPEVFVLPCPALASHGKELAPSIFGESSGTPVRTLLFYARPTKARRNLFELGYHAITRAIQLGIFDSTWRFISVGETMPHLPLADGAILENIPWMGYAQYLRLVEQSAIYLAPMNSPHTGFPVLEAAQLGSVGVTTSYATKDIEFFAGLSPRIVASEPTSPSLISALSRAARLADSPPSADEMDLGDYVQEWAISTRQAADWIFAQIRPAQVPTFHGDLEKLSQNLRCDVCANSDASDGRPVKFTLGISIYNTPVDLLEECLQSIRRIRSPLGTSLEVLILNNGSTENGSLVADLVSATLPDATYLELPTNGGIVSGMRELLSNANGEYFIPVDSDDLVSPTAVELLYRHLVARDFPEFLYSDELVFNADGTIQPFVKGPFDPVLSTEICQTAHLNCFRVDVARQLGVYEPGWPEGSHDWATSAQFWRTGHRIEYCPHVLYGWRAHSGSTSINWRGKPYVVESQRAAMQVMAKGFGAEDPAFTHHPGFLGGPNQRLDSPSDLASMGVRLITLSLGERRSESSALSSIPTDVMEALDRPSSGGQIDHLVWFTPQKGPMPPSAVREVASLVHVYGRNNVFTGSSLTAGEVVAAPRSDRDLYHNDLLPGNYFTMISRVCRKTVARVNPFNCLVPLSSVTWALQTLELSSLEEVALAASEHARDQGARMIASPSLTVTGGYPANRALMELAEDMWAATRDSCTAELSTSHSRDAGLPAETLELALDTDLGDQTLAVITTLRGSLDAALLEALFDSLVSQLSSACTWRVHVHGRVGKSLQTLLDRLSIQEHVALMMTREELTLTEAVRRSLREVAEEFVLFADSDDLLLEGAVAALLGATKLSQDVDAVLGDEVVGDSIANSRYFRRQPLNNLGPREFSQFFHPIVVRRELLEAVGFPFDSSEFFHDWSLMDVMLQSGRSIVRDCPRFG